MKTKNTQNHTINHRSRAHRAWNRIRHGGDIMKKVLEPSTGGLGGVLWGWYLEFLNYFDCLFLFIITIIS